MALFLRRHLRPMLAWYLLFTAFATVAAAHGWAVQDNRKHVWARIDYASPFPRAPQRPRSGSGPAGRKHLL